MCTSDSITGERKVRKHVQTIEKNVECEIHQI